MRIWVWQNSRITWALYPWTSPSGATWCVSMRAIMCYQQRHKAEAGHAKLIPDWQVDYELNPRRRRGGEEVAPDAAKSMVRTRIDVYRLQPYLT